MSIEKKNDLAPAETAPKTMIHKSKTNPNQEDSVSKNKPEKTKSKPKAEKAQSNLPTYGLEVRRTSVPSTRWIIVDALMALSEPTSAERVAKTVTKAMAGIGKDAEQTLKDVRSVAAWLGKQNTKFVGLEKATKVKAEKAPKTEKVKTKASKPKVKKAAASEDGELLG